MLDLLLERYALRYTPAVALELREEFPSGRAVWERVRGGELTEAIPRTEIVRDFGPGERASINLALERRDEGQEWVLLLDDQRPFREAAERGLPVICSPVLVVALHAEGRLDAQQALTSLARLAALGTVSPHLLAAALAQVATQTREGGR